MNEKDERIEQLQAMLSIFLSYGISISDIFLTLLSELEKEFKHEFFMQKLS